MVNKLNKKYYVLIWIAAFLAGFIGNIYNFYTECEMLVGLPRAEVAINVFVMILTYGIVPMAVDFLVAFVVYMFSFRRFIRFISRNDFCLLTMLALAISSAVTGFIDVFSFLIPEVGIFTSSLSGVVMDFTAMAVLFFVVFSRVYKPNPIEKARAFNMWSIVFMVLLGIEVVGGNALIIMMSDASYYELVSEILIESGMEYELVQLSLLANNPICVGVSIAAIVIFAIEVIAVIILNIRLKSNARSYQNPETREEYMAKHYQPFGYEVRDGVESTFEEFSDNGNVDNSQNNKKDNVFDEFDL